MRVDDLEEVTALAAASRGFGDRFVAALAAKDGATLLAMFADEVDFRGLTPGRSWEARTGTEAVDDVILGKWFEPSDTIERVETVETGMVVDRHSLRYRLRLSNDGGRFVVEQHAFYDIADGRVTWMRVLCSGFRPVTGSR
jgi:ketosteroid isomerase-like protein